MTENNDLRIQCSGQWWSNNERRYVSCNRTATQWDGNGRPWCDEHVEAYWGPPTSETQEDDGTTR